MHSWSDLLGDDGPFARAIDGFAKRDEQVAMAERVAAALKSRGRLVIEAGTGVGKTFAYLVPALLSGRKVIVSTGTRTLQDQLFHRDLPVVAAAIGRPVRVALLKGRANYLCLHRLTLAEQQFAARGLRRDLAAALPEVREWALSTRRGDIAELIQLSDTDPVWPWVTSTRDNCIGVDCPEFERCHLVAARREAQAADIVIVNHHLLMADLVLKDSGFGDLLPGADAIVIDEAHQLPQTAANFLGFVVTGRQLQSLAKDLTAELVLCGQPLQVSAASAQTLEGCAANLHDIIGAGNERLEFDRWSNDLLEAIDTTRRHLVELARKLGDLADRHASIAAVQRRATELAQRMTVLGAAQHAEAKGGVRWAHAGTGYFSLHFAPVEVAEQLGELFSSHDCAWIFTSATLAVGADFSHFMRQIGVEDAANAQFGSPFDYARQAMLYLPQGLDIPSSPRHTRQVVEAALPVLAASGGRAFLLFTSHRALREAAQILTQALGRASPYPVLVQGDAPREALLDRFRAHGNAVLLGTSSFWEGVDVKGPALSVVVIDKLPFAVPDDPVLKARFDAIEKRGGNPFLEEQVPQAVITLKQGVGRLIRDQTDFGVVMICDQRVRTRAYGKIFIESLPPMRRTRSLVDVTQFLNTRLGLAGVLDSMPNQERRSSSS